MTPIHLHRRVPYRPEQLFEVAADIKDYPRFLKNCVATRIVKQDGDVLWVDNVFRWGLFPFRFRTRAVLNQPHRIDIETVDVETPSFRLSWAFWPKGALTEVQFTMAVDVALPILGHMVSDSVRTEAEVIEKAFLRQVEQRYKT
ncbi:SRPBCC family protein [Magnetovibrio sp. PR-2]|uniref:type II toxin-antitoxin system RatA family toxin n=1 Tax=Magnetovibrio sp. PR-2 TaxID=3120356 RepID=UPI002FCE48AC